MFAVIRTGGKQYRVAPNDIIEIERVAGEPGDIIELSEVLLVGGGDRAPQTGGHKAGAPTISGALVAAEVIEQMRGDKITVFKKKRRKNYRRKKGHRQALTLLRITEILTDGKKPSKTKGERPAPKKAEPKAPKAETKAKPEAKSKKPATKKAAPAKKPAKKVAKALARKPASKPKKK
jgi:large subunit ribosomal protein L21